MCWTLHIFDEIKLFLTSILKKMNSESKTLRQKGNGHYNALKKYAFNYESSIIISQKDIGAYS
jgi:hypothetical protein